MDGNTTPLRVGIYGRQSQAKVKSVNEQITDVTADAEAEGMLVVRVYSDLVSASRYSGKDRGDYNRLVADVEAGQLDAVAVWKPDRADRSLTPWSAFLDLCRDNGKLIRVTEHRYTYDLSNGRDWKSLAQDGVEAAAFSDKLSADVKRGLAGAAKLGRPAHGVTPFGWVKIYDEHSGDLIGMEPHPEQAPVVVAIITRLSEGEPPSDIAKDLNARGVLAARGGPWRRSRIKDVLQVVHIGYRQHNGDRHRGDWDPIVAEATFWAARRIVDSRKRGNERPGRSQWVLRGVARCEVCGGTLVGANTFQRGKHVRKYRCVEGHVTVKADEFEEHVLGYVLGRLARRDVYEQLRHVGEDADAEVAAAEADAARLRDRLDEYRQRARRGAIDPDDFAEIAAGLKADIKAAEQRAQRAGVPPQVRALLEPGEDLATRWAGMPLAARRDVVKALVEVVVHRGQRGKRISVADRVSITWKAAEST